MRNSLVLIICFGLIIYFGQAQKAYKAKILEFKGLYQEGVISEEEYEAKTSDEAFWWTFLNPKNVFGVQ